VRRAVGHGSELLSGAEATEASLKRKDLAPFGVLHFATHAVADDAYPDRSAVLLASGSATEDGLLQPREISALDLRGRAVILSACQTAAGPYVDGEGVFSLARAFFEGGARTIVAGLWRLRDDETERLMLSFYDGVAEGRTMAASLRWARERAVTDGLPTAAWAGVVLLGDADLALPHSPSSAWPARVAWASGVVLAAGLAAWWRRRQR
jgi:CHAT domain-containing protein